MQDKLGIEASYKVQKSLNTNPNLVNFTKSQRLLFIYFLINLPNNYLIVYVKVACKPLSTFIEVRIKFKKIENAPKSPY